MGGDPTGRLPTTVYVLKYDHKHGTDLSVYLNEDDAWVGAGHLMLEWVANLCEGEDYASAEAVLDLLEKGEYGEAASKWPVLAGDTEFIEVEAVKVYPSPPEVTKEDVDSVRKDITPDSDDGG